MSYVAQKSPTLTNGHEDDVEPIEDLVVVVVCGGGGGGRNVDGELACLRVLGNLRHCAIRVDVYT